MKHEKIFKREDGRQITISVSVYVDMYRNTDENVVYNTNITYREKGKKKWLSIHNFDSYLWRQLSINDRIIANRKKELEYVTLEEMQITALEFWQKIKPKFI